MKKFLKILLRVFIVLLVIIIMLSLGGIAYVVYMRWQADQSELVTYNESGDMIISKKNVEYVMEDPITCLFLGVNGNLTDFIMLGKYDPNTRKVNLMSIPRDTKVDGTIDGKINSAYAGIDPKRTINKVQDLTGVKVDYYILFKTKVLRELVDAVDGVTIDVPINMNYDDPYQNLHIHLKKGVQKLDGAKAEQFCRFRKNNNNTGYVNGDVDRVKAQQTFIKAMISRCLEPQNLMKIADLLDIVLNNTDTNITKEIASKYIDDAIVFKADRVRIETLPGAGGYAKNGISYFFMDEVEGKALIAELFNEKVDMEEVKEVHNIDVIIESGSINQKDSGEEEPTYSGELIRVEVLNAGVDTKVFTKVVNILNKSGYAVDRVGNVSENSDNLSKVINHTFGKKALENMDSLSKLVGISKLENDFKLKPEVEFTIILGPKYSI